MGQKVNPNGMRVGINRDWSSRWYANNQDYSTFLLEDIKIRKFLTEKLKNALLSHVEIERKKNDKGQYVEVSCFVARVGVALGQDGANAKSLQKALSKQLKGSELKLNIVEVKEPDLDAALLAQDMATQLENRASFRSVQKKAIQKARKAGAKGCKTMISGRLAGADIARSEGYHEGVIPLHTLRSDIDYALAEAATTYGRLGCKVWICRGEKRQAKKVVSKKGE